MSPHHMTTPSIPFLLSAFPISALSFRAFCASLRLSPSLRSVVRSPWLVVSGQWSLLHSALRSLLSAYRLPIFLPLIFLPNSSSGFRSQVSALSFCAFCASLRPAVSSVLSVIPSGFRFHLSSLQWSSALRTPHSALNWCNSCQPYSALRTPHSALK